MKLVLYGAGSIGRSFIGQIFSRAGWEVVFVDVDQTLIDALNEKRRYTVVVKDRVERTILVENVRGVQAGDLKAVRGEVAEADLAATAVGQGALPRVMRSLAAGLLRRWRLFPNRPLDIIICENLHNAAVFFGTALQEELRKEFKLLQEQKPHEELSSPELTEDYPFDSLVGLVETSIGKMVPIMSDKDRKRDPLLVYAEEYNTLLLDRKGFKGPVPDVPELDPKDNMKAYVDRKLYIHNLGHAVLCYVSFVFRPAYVYVWEAALDGGIAAVTRSAMWESGKALIAEYPGEFDERSMGAHIEDLLGRFGNRALGDTIFRAGRDLYRKLGPEDRLVGAVHLCLKHGVAPPSIALAIASALSFKAVDEWGEMLDRDRLFHEREAGRGFDHVMKAVCRLENPEALRLIWKFFDGIRKGAVDLPPG
jgi:mannitol-1-phosphate 5-dehydrogenase